MNLLIAGQLRNVVPRGKETILLNAYHCLSQMAPCNCGPFLCILCSHSWDGSGNNDSGNDYCQINLRKSQVGI